MWRLGLLTRMACSDRDFPARFPSRCRRGLPRRDRPARSAHRSPDARGGQPRRPPRHCPGRCPSHSTRSCPLCNLRRRRHQPAEQRQRGQERASLRLDATGGKHHWCSGCGRGLRAGLLHRGRPAAVRAVASRRRWRQRPDASAAGGRGRGGSAAAEVSAGGAATPGGRGFLCQQPSAAGGTAGAGAAAPRRFRCGHLCLSGAAAAAALGPAAAAACQPGGAATDRPDRHQHRRQPSECGGCGGSSGSQPPVPPLLPACPAYTREPPATLAKLRWQRAQQHRPGGSASTASSSGGDLHCGRPAHWLHSAAAVQLGRAGRRGRRAAGSVSQPHASGGAAAAAAPAIAGCGVCSGSASRGGSAQRPGVFAALRACGCWRRRRQGAVPAAGTGSGAGSCRTAAGRRGAGQQQLHARCRSRGARTAGSAAAAGPAAAVPAVRHRRWLPAAGVPRPRPAGLHPQLAAATPAAAQPAGDPFSQRQRGGGWLRVYNAAEPAGLARRGRLGGAGRSCGGGNGLCGGSHQR